MKAKAAATALLLLLPASLAIFPRIQAQESQTGMQTRVFRLPFVSPNDLLLAASDLPAGLCSYAYPETDFQKPKLPPDPFEAPPSPPAYSDPFGPPPPAEPRPTIQDVLQKIGIPFPAGAYAWLDWENRALVVHHTDAMLEMVGHWLDIQERDMQPCVIAITTHCLELPAARLPELTAASGHSHDEKPALTRLLDEAAKPGSAIKLVHATFHETKSGQLSTLTSAAKFNHTRNLALDAKQQATVESTTQPLGLQLDFDPTLSSDGDIIHLNLSHALTRNTDQSQNGITATPIGGIALSWPMPGVHEERSVTSLTLWSGHPRLVSHWSSKDHPSTIQALFITAHAVRQQPTVPDLPADFKATAKPTSFITKTFPFGPIWEAWEYMLDGMIPDQPLRQAGIVLPKGSTVSHDKKSDTLTIHTTRAVMSLVEAWHRSETNMSPLTTSFTLETLRVPASTAHPLLLEAAPLSDHSPLLARLQAAASEGDAQRVAFARIEARSCQQTSIETVLNRQQLASLAWKSDSRPALKTAFTPCGLRLHLDPTIGIDAFTIDVTCHLERHLGPPQERLEHHRHPANSNGFHMPYDTLRVSETKTSGIFMDGAAKIISAECPVNEHGDLMADVLDLSFLTCRITRHHPRPPEPHHHSVPESLAALLPKAPATAPEMETRAFRVPPDFLMSHPPFSDRNTPRTAREILEEQGIIFPEGSAVVFDLKSSQLVARNTADNLDQIEAYIGWPCCHSPKTVLLQLHLFQINGSELSAFIPANDASDDHTPVLRKLRKAAKNGQAQRLNSLSLTASNGQRAVMEQTRNTPTLSQIKVKPDGAPELLREDHPAGTRFEIDPVLGGDGQTLDLTYTLEHHFAPPATRSINLAAPEDPPIAIPLTDFHVEKTAGGLTLIAGTARVLAIWKPAGHPEFEGKDLLHIAILEAQVE